MSATERVEAFDAIARRRHIERDGVLYTADLLTRNGGSLSGVSVWSRDKVWLADPDDDGMIEVIASPPASEEGPVTHRNDRYYCTACGDPADDCVCGAMDALAAAEDATWD